jgi:hypothetical protein
VKSRNDNPFLPPARVISMIVILAILLTGIFSLMTASWIVGTALGVAFAAAFYFIVVVNARRAVGKRRRRAR